MRIDGDQPIEGIRQKMRDLPRRYGLARLETPILAHVGEIWRYEADL